MYVEMADHVSARRASSNTFFLTTNTVVLSALGFFGKVFALQGGVGLIASLVVLTGTMIFCEAWTLILSSYDQLNNAKFLVIHELEEKLPVALYSYEWKKLGEGKDPQKYRPLTRVEKYIPKAFILAYLLLAVLWIIGALFPTI
jgi:hypothetical protein